MIASNVAQEVQALDRLDLEALREAWRRRWGAPPKLRSRELLAHAMAYKLQASAFGDLPLASRRRLDDLAKRFDSDRKFRPSAAPHLAVGCSLVREWGGQRHEVKVVEGGFDYLGETFSSLSAVAQHITGAKRSGVLFFGLKTKSQAR